MDYLYFITRLYRSCVDSHYVPFRKYSRRVIRYWRHFSYKVYGSYPLREMAFRDSKMYLPLPRKNSVCELLGYVPDPIGSPPSKIVEPNSDFMRWLASSRYNEGDVTSFLREHRVTLTSGFDTTLGILREFAKEPKYDMGYRDIITFLEIEDFPWLKLPKLDFPTIDDLSHVLVNTKSYSGYFTSKFFGQTKGISAGASLSAARYIFDTLVNRKRVWKYEGLWTLGGREKDVNLDKPDGTDLLTRAVWMPEHVLVILGGVLVQPLTLAFQRLHNNCLFIGKNFNTDETDWLRSVNRMHDWKIRCDWELFDSHVTSNEIYAAFQILRACYPEGRHIDRYFAFMADTMVNKNLVLPPGFVFRVSKGIPSGHPFTSLIGSVINYMRWVIILQRFYGKGNVASSAYAVFSGDDSKIWLTKKPEHNFFEIDEIMSRYFPDWRCDRVTNTLTPSSDTTRDVIFLKRYFEAGYFIGWDLRSVLKKFSYPSKSNNGLDRLITTYLSYAEAAPGNNYPLTILLDYLKYRTKLAYRRFPSVCQARLHMLKKLSQDAITKGYLRQIELVTAKEVPTFLVDYGLGPIKYETRNRVSLLRLIDKVECVLTNLSGSLTQYAILCACASPLFLKKFASAMDKAKGYATPQFFLKRVDIDEVAKIMGVGIFDEATLALHLLTEREWGALFVEKQIPTPHFMSQYRKINRLFGVSNRLMRLVKGLKVHSRHFPKKFYDDTS